MFCIAMNYYFILFYFIYKLFYTLYIYRRNYHGTSEISLRDEEEIQREIEKAEVEKPEFINSVIENV